MQFLDFPQGSDLWVIKWIDGYQQAHRNSRSPSVGVCLQKLPYSGSPSQRGWSAAKVADVFSRPFQADITYKIVRVLTGFLPCLRIGQLYCERRLVGTLPSEVYNVTLTAGEDSGRTIRLKDELEAPPGWTKRFRLLNPSQYHVPFHFEESRCWVQKNHAGSDIIVPRTLIEQTFYFPHSVIANAAATGPWSEYKKKLICFEKLASGLQTKIDPDTGEWHVILQTRVKDPYAPLMALFNFDPYASRCAEQIYAQSLQDRGTSRFAPWYASGRIPFAPDGGQVRLRLRGHWLKKVPLKGSETFLVTHIAGFSFPASVPGIWWERANSGQESTNPEDTPMRRPYGGVASGELGSPDRPVDSTQDGDPQRGLEEFEGMDVVILSGPPVRKLEKDSHKTSPKDIHPPIDGSTEGVASPGFDSGSTEAHRKAHLESAVLPAPLQFINLMDVLQSLLQKGIVESFGVVDPPSDKYRTSRDGLSCWHFLDERLRTEGNRLPRRGWFIVNPREERPILRAALVLEITVFRQTLYWIEIERRRTESGMVSPVLTGLPGENVLEAIGYTLQTIASDRHGLRDRLSRIAKELGPTVGAELFHHGYVYSVDAAGRKHVSGIREATVTKFLHRATHTGR